MSNVNLCMIYCKYTLNVTNYTKYTTISFLILNNFTYNHTYITGP